jgi:prevent-host-death family protein
MADLDESVKGYAEIGADAARVGLTQLMGRVAFGNERIILTRNGKQAAALVPMKDLERLGTFDEVWP